MRSNDSSPEATRTWLSALILAGGQSSRMGQDKALLQVGQVPMLQHVCQVAQQCTDAVYVITPWVDRYRAIVGDGIELIEEQTSSDPLFAQHGPLVGFAQGLTHLQTVQPRSEWVLLLACDLPYLQPEILQDWIAQLPLANADTIALLPRHPNGWWEALCGFYRCRCLESLEAFIPEGGRSFQRWLSHQSVQELSLPEPQMLFNCNTPEDVKKAEAQRMN
ncbi:molybdenum cofactor guanylyltransferase [Egbenema bharatensis]|uniref:molybdenum cofactor guanylyltransferase n=1 Tax=Egbenema bharatensis TaxID=3463334 RepID=UPI003A8B50AB